MTKVADLPQEVRDDEQIVKFEETFKWPGHRRCVTFDGPQYQEWIYQALPIARDLRPLHHLEAKTEGVKVGDAIFYLRPLPLWRLGSSTEGFGFFGGAFSSKVVPIRCKLEVYRNRTAGYCAFSTEINIPVLAREDWDGLTPWMSLTPNEILTQRGQIRRAKGDTAIAGLGLGWAARKILERKQVKHLTIYERSQDILDYFGASLMADFPGKVTLIQADAYRVDWSRHDVSLWDIWTNWGDAAWDHKFKKIQSDLSRAGKICVGWGQGVSKA